MKTVSAYACKAAICDIRLEFVSLGFGESAFHNSVGCAHSPVQLVDGCRKCAAAAQPTQSVY